MIDFVTLVGEGVVWAFASKPSFTRTFLFLRRSPNQQRNAVSSASNTIGKMKEIDMYEQVILVPHFYLGPTVKCRDKFWVYENGEMVYRSISYVPALFKIFDMILLDAAKNIQRDPSLMGSIKVTIDPEENTISVYNNGCGIPVDLHPEKKIYYPEMAFGQYTIRSSDYSVVETCGLRCVGAKYANIFSTEFVVKTADGVRSKKYKQVFTNNMKKKSVPEIRDCNANENWTKVTFKPDLEKFKMDSLEDDVVVLMTTRVLEIAGCLGKSVKVKLNGVSLRINSFKDFVNLYLKSAEKSRQVTLPRFHEKVGDKWEICVSLSDGLRFQQVSFVNTIATYNGGTHVNHITDQIATHLMNKVNQKHKEAIITDGRHVKRYLWVFVNALIDDPRFRDREIKTDLITFPDDFGSKCVVPKSMLNKVATVSRIMKPLLLLADYKLSQDFKPSQDLKKADDGTKTQMIGGIVKQEDANEAGGDFKLSKDLKKADGTKTQMIGGIVKQGDANDTGEDFKLSKDLRKADGTKTKMIGGIVKLDDANDAGGRNSEMTQLKRILLHPDSYVGSVEKQVQKRMVYENDELVYRSISYVPALYKIFEEILVIAVDNKQRDPSMDSLIVKIDRGVNTISVYNNGYGIPVEIHPEEKVYVPELIFGHLLTSSNYDLNGKKTTDGQEGYGAKLTNIFSTKFVVETADGRRLKKYKQVFTKNMRKKSVPEITKCKGNENWTEVTFKPDLEKFKMTYLEEDDVVMMKHRVMEMAKYLGESVKVELDGRSLPCMKSVKDIVDLYSVQPSCSRSWEKERWEKACCSKSQGTCSQGLSKEDLDPLNQLNHSLHSISLLKYIK